MSQPDELRRQRQAIVDRYGPWTAHNIDLGGGVRTMDGDTLGAVEGRVRRIIQVCADLMAPLGALRVADLGAGEGSLAVEFAARGAQVVAIDGRDANLEKMRFASSALGLETLEIVKDDVRNFDVDRYGHFDVVLAVGIVYHFDVPEVFDILANIEGACRAAIIDTEIHLGDGPDTFERDGVVYRGWRYDEPSANPDLDQHGRDVLWASMGNPHSFVFTRSSLFNAMQASGFTAVLDCSVPALPSPVPRVTVLATAGQRERFRTVPWLTSAPIATVTEPRTPLSWATWRRLPPGVRAVVKRAMRRRY